MLRSRVRQPDEQIDGMALKGFHTVRESIGHQFQVPVLLDGHIVQDHVEQMLALKRENAPGYGRVPLEKILFARGTLLFWYRDYDQALADFARVTGKARELDLNTEVLAWLRTGQIRDLLGQRQQAVAAYRKLLELAPESERADEAKQYLRRPYKRG